MVDPLRYQFCGLLTGLLTGHLLLLWILWLMVCPKVVVRLFLNQFCGLLMGPNFNVTNGFIMYQSWLTGELNPCMTGRWIFFFIENTYEVWYDVLISLFLSSCFQDICWVPECWGKCKLDLTCIYLLLLLAGCLIRFLPVFLFYLERQCPLE